MDKKLKIASLFAGIGGIDLSFKQAGFEIVFANDNNKAVCKTYRYNFPDERLDESNIKKINAEGLPDFDVLTAGFPCQSFSLSGNQKGFDDPRGNLFFDIIRIAHIKKPQVIFLENVSNLLEHDNGNTFLKIYYSLCESGYFVRYNVMTPVTHGDIPHKRERIFIVAFRDYEMCSSFKFPEPIPLTKTIADIINPSIKHSECYYYKDTDYYYGELISKVKLKNMLYKIALNCVFRKPYNVCPTLLASMGKVPHRIPILLDDFGIRSLTPIECLAFQGFPTEYSFPSGTTMADAYKQTGNSVCVPVIRRIAEQIMQALKNHRNK